MAEFSPLAVDCAPPPFAADHHLDGRPVLPAVEAMELLAGCAAGRYPGLDTACLTDLRFEKFLFLDPPPPALQMGLESSAPDAVSATLQSRSRGRRSAMTRVKIHAAMTIGPVPPEASIRAPVLFFPSEVEIKTVSAERIYPELVTFGPHYRNIVGDLMLAPQGALARIGSPATDERGFILGSPYVLDAAFHAACIWSQRFAAVVAFPVGLAGRRIFVPTTMTETYWARVVSLGSVGSTLVFDIFIFDGSYRLREAAWGVRMQDVSGGRRRPPAWIVKGVPTAANSDLDRFDELPDE